MTHTVHHDAQGNVNAVELWTANGWLIRVTEAGAELYRPHISPPAGVAWPLDVRENLLRVTFAAPLPVNEATPGKAR